MRYYFFRYFFFICCLPCPVVHFAKWVRVRPSNMNATQSNTHKTYNAIRPPNENWPKIISFFRWYFFASLPCYVHFDVYFLFIFDFFDLLSLSFLLLRIDPILLVIRFEHRERWFISILTFLYWSWFLLYFFVKLFTDVSMSDDASLTVLLFH